MSTIIRVTGSLPVRQRMPTFKEYKEDIQSFNTDEYLRNKMESDNIILLSNFLEIYKRIEEEDLKKPIFSQTTKFKKFPNHLKYYKYVKFSREEETKKGWFVKKPMSEVENILLFLNSNFNKMGEDNIETVIGEMIHELETYDHPELFEILANEIFNKCIQDSKYRVYYLQLAYQIWVNRQIHLNRFEIIDLESDFYVKFKYPQNEHGLDGSMNEDNIIGPFNNEMEAYNNAYKLMTFKKYFVNFLHKKFTEKDVKFVMDEMSDTEFFEKKRQVLGLVDIMLIMFYEKYIHMDILHLMILNFLHINGEMFDTIEEIEIEAVYNIIKGLYQNQHIIKTKYPIFDFYLTKFEDILKLKEDSTNQVIKMTKRIEFFIGEMRNYIQNAEIVTEGNENNESVANVSSTSGTTQIINRVNNAKMDVKTMTQSDIIKLLKKNLREENRQQFVDVFGKYVSVNDRTIFMKDILIYILEQKDINEKWVDIIDSLEYRDNQIEAVESIIENFADLSLDICDLHKKLLKMIDYMKQIKMAKKLSWKEKIYELMKQDADDSDSDSDSDSDKSQEEDDDETWESGGGWR